MEFLESIFEVIYDHAGVITGSFVRDCLIRKESISVNRDIDVLVPFSFMKDLETSLIEKFQADMVCLCYNEEDCVCHYLAYIGDYEFDIFSGGDYGVTYLSPPDADVNILCYDGLEYSTWFPLENIDIQDIMKRISEKKALPIYKEWAEDERDHLQDRLQKLLNKGWEILPE